MATSHSYATLYYIYSFRHKHRPDHTHRIYYENMQPQFTEESRAVSKLWLTRSPQHPPSLRHGPPTGAIPEWVWFGWLLCTEQVFTSHQTETQRLHLHKQGLNSAYKSPGANFRAVCHFNIINVHIPSFHTFKRKLRYRKEHRYIFDLILL